MGITARIQAIGTLKKTKHKDLKAVMSDKYY
jgi:hypothetical protein